MVDTACSSALVAMDAAAQALRSGDIESAVVAGVSLLTDDRPYQVFGQRGLLNPGAEFHVFDRRGAGLVLGEGIGVVVLKPLDRARADGDQVLAVLKGIAVNNDGRTAGPATPNLEAHKEVMTEALTRSGLSPQDVGWVEANGSGSAVTDLLELKAVETVYRAGSAQPVALGSVKPNIGHPLAAEGIASFIKVVLMLHHRQQAPFGSGQQPLEHFDLDASPLYFPRRAEPWPASAEAAAVSCFADGGTNAHLLLAPLPRATGAPGRRSRDPSGTAGSSSEGRLSPPCPMRGSSGTNTARRSRAHSPSGATTGPLRPGRPRAMAVDTPTQPLPVVFMFPGQGSQYYRMGEELLAGDEVFGAALRRYDAMVAEELGESVLARVFDASKRKSEPFTDTRFTHPAIVMIELALAETLRAAGVEPDYLIGCSLGEYAAATLSGSLDASDCMGLLVGQAAALRRGPRGGMLAVLAGPDVLDRVPALRECEVAARNHPGHFVVSGTEEAVVRAESALRAADVPHQRVAVEYGYHSALMAPVLAECRGALDRTRFAPPRIPWVSCVDGRLVERPGAEHFRRVVREPIEFERTMAAMRDRGDFLYLDLGPSGTLDNFVRGNAPPGTRSRSLSLLSPFGHDPAVLAKVRTLTTRPPQTSRTPRKAQRMKVYGFPGQGSQRRGMGAELFERFPEQTAIADRVLGYSIRELCVEDPERRLGSTEFTQPALYVVSALAHLDRVAADPVPPDYLVGHSLGEYAALFAAGVYDFETGLRLVRRRGELMTASDGGTMAAVVGTDEATVERVLAEPGLDGLDLANLNAMDQFVLSGPVERIDAACAAFDAMGARTARLNVSAPFHSRYMRGAAEEFARFLDEFTLRPPAVPVLANVDARPYRPEALKETLAAQIVSPVRWTETVRSLMGQGDFEFVELGPGEVLTKLVARIRQRAEPLPAPVSRPDPAPAPPPRRFLPGSPSRPTAWAPGASASGTG